MESRVALQDADPARLAGVLQEEGPQTIALVLSHLPPSRSAAILAGLCPPARADVAMRIATIDEIPAGVVEHVERLLLARLGQAASPAEPADSQGERLPAGLSRLVAVLRYAEATSQAIIGSLSETNPELTAAIKRRMLDCSAAPL